MATAPTATSSAQQGSPTPRNLKGFIGIIIAVPIALGLMLLAFAAPASHSGPHHLPLAVSGPPAATEALTAALRQKAPDMFDVESYPSAGDAIQAIRDRKDIGGITLSPTGATIHLASGAGSPYPAVLTTLGETLKSQGRQVNYIDQAPLPTTDPAGTSVTSAGLPLISGGMVTAALLFFGLRGSVGLRVLGVAAIATLAGLISAAVLEYLLDVIDAPYWKLAAAVTMGMAAISYFVLGLAKNLGGPGFGIGALTLLVLSNPISALATGPAWLPQPWGAIGQLLPVGAAGTLLRSAAYFDGRGATQAWIVLSCWAAGGLALLALGRLRNTEH